MKMNRGFYYDLLDIDQQVLYKKIGKAVANMEEEISVRENLDAQQLKKIFMAISYDNPKYFYWNSNKSEWKDGKVTLQYEMTKEEAQQVTEKLVEEREKFLKECNAETQADKEKILLRLYEYLANHVEYAYEELQNLESSSKIYSIQGALLDKKAVCLGIAQTVNYFLSALHIPHILVTGEAKIGGNMENHAWNMVKVNDKYRHIDVTAEICDGKDLQYKYFLLQDWELGNRKMPKDIYPPAK